MGDEGMTKPFSLQDAMLGQRLILDSDIVMQYTGIKDKNGFEIYEGDIITGVFSGNPKVKISGAVSFWEKGLAWAVAVHDGSAYMLASVDNIEVIGNIYENPDLLEAKE